LICHLQKPTLESVAKSIGRPISEISSNSNPSYPANFTLLMQPSLLYGMCCKAEVAVYKLNDITVREDHLDTT